MELKKEVFAQPADVFQRREACMLCKRPALMDIVSLGNHALIDFLDPAADFNNVPKAPLTLARCNACGLVQLREQVKPALLYGVEKGTTYWYRSSGSKTMRDHLEALAGILRILVGLKEGDIVVDIGCNDGYFLRRFPPIFQHVGYEPGPTLAAMARRIDSASCMIFNELFSARPYNGLHVQRAKLVTALAMFYDVPDPVDFCRDVADILAPDGVFVIELNDLGSMIKNTAFDMIGHEHQAYYTIPTLEQALAMAKLRLFHVDYSSINGGSLLAFADHGLAPVSASVAEARDHDQAIDLDAVWDCAFNGSLAAQTLHNFVLEEKRKRRSVYLYGASTRGNTIIQAARLDHTLIDGAAEIHPDKIGLVLAGSGIPVFHEADARRRADTFIVMPYSYRDDILVKEAEWRADPRHAMVFPLPKLEVIGHHDDD